MYILAQITGVLAVASYLLSYQFKKRKHIILVNATSSCLYVLQYILLGAPFWLVYNLANEAYGSAIGNTLAIISLLIAIYRYDIKPGIKKQG